MEADEVGERVNDVMRGSVRLADDDNNDEDDDAKVGPRGVSVSRAQMSPSTCSCCCRKLCCSCTEASSWAIRASIELDEWWMNVLCER